MDVLQSTSSRSHGLILDKLAYIKFKYIKGIYKRIQESPYKGLGYSILDPDHSGGSLGLPRAVESGSLSHLAAARWTVAVLGPDENSA
jgi:hypothetical protein